MWETLLLIYAIVRCGRWLFRIGAVLVLLLVLCSLPQQLGVELGAIVLRLAAILFVIRLVFGGCGHHRH